MSGVNTPRAASPSQPSRPPLQRRATSQPPPTKSVKFNLSPDSSGPSSPAQIRERRERSKGTQHNDESDSDVSPRSKSPNTPHNRNQQIDPDEEIGNDRPRRRRHRLSTSEANPWDRRDPSPTSSDSTVDLPSRFDERGRRIPEPGDQNQDPLTENIQKLLNGNGTVGRLLSSFGLGGGGSEDEASSGRRNRDGERRRRRRRRS